MDIINNFILNNISYAWMVFGIILIILEVLTTPGIGILCAGLAAIMVGIMILSSLIFDNSYIIQFGWFFAWTVVWAAVLWKPLLQLRHSKPNYHNIVGERAVVYKNDLVKGKTGVVKWSGTVMNALIIDASGVSFISVNQEVIIKDLKGNVLLVDIAT
ncbi:hypothetical protein NOVO_01615 [Rickettsiales bacterium Ac37b]|nr:hypothetical protein NOVO_01615 [Rickettsiales bacterium Ac37b]